MYYITGVVAIPTQFILTSSLSKDFHTCLRVLSNKASKEDIEHFIEMARSFTEPIDKQNADAESVYVSGIKRIDERRNGRRNTDCSKGS